MIQRHIPFLTLPLICLLIGNAVAEGLTVLNPSGEVLSVNQLEQDSELRLNVNDPAGAPSHGDEITLTDTTSGEKIVGKTADGMITFPQVSSGTYVISSDATGLQFLNFEVVALSSSLGAALPVVGGVLVAGGATTAIVVASEDDDEPTPLSPFD